MGRPWSRPALALATLIALSLASHLPDVNAPPRGYHQWRQTQTLAVARNLAEESPNLLAPRVDGRGDTDGVAGMEFPLVNGLVALAYRMFGFSHAAGRLVVFAFGAFAIVQCHRLHRELFASTRAGLIAAFLLACSPLFLYYSFVVMPDVPMLALLLGSLAHFVRWSRAPRSRDLALALALLTLAGLVKSPAMIAFPWYFATLARRPGPRARRLAAALVPLLVVAAWVLHARQLSAHSGIHDFRLEFTPATDLAEYLRVTRKVFLQWLPEVFLNYAEVPFLLAGAVLLARGRGGPGGLRRRLGWLAVPLAAYMLSQYRMLEMHDYYMMIGLAILVPIATVGALALDTSAPRGRALLAAALVLIAAVGGVRVHQRCGNFDRRRLATLVTLEAALPGLGVPPEALVAVGADRSPSIDLYFCHRKGWTIPGQSPPTELPGMIRRGARFLISDSRALEARDDVRPYLVKRGAWREFNVFELGPR